MNKNTTTTGQWWHDEMNELAGQLSKGVLNEMKRRIRTSNIQKEKLTLGENTDRMRQFFEREVRRYTKRKDAQRVKAHTPANSGSGNAQQYQDIIRKLLECNQSLAKKIAIDVCHEQPFATRRRLHAPHRHPLLVDAGAALVCDSHIRRRRRSKHRSNDAGVVFIHPNHEMATVGRERECRRADALRVFGQQFEHGCHVRTRRRERLLLIITI
jgi:hypothetical protein